MKRIGSVAVGGVGCAFFAPATVAVACAAVAAPPLQTRAPCSPPAPPKVLREGSTWIVFTGAANPRGRETYAFFRIGDVRTYRVMLGRGHAVVRWQMALGSLRPGRRYTVVAWTLSPGCRTKSATTFRTPPETSASGAVPVSPSLAPMSPPDEPTAAQPVDDWSW